MSDFMHPDDEEVGCTKPDALGEKADIYVANRLLVELVL